MPSTPATNLIPTYSASHQSVPVAGNISQETSHSHQGATAVPQVRSSSSVPVMSSSNNLPNNLQLPDSLFNVLMQPSSTNNLPFERSSSSLPPLPQNILEQIQAGKFVKFDDLLPAVSSLNNIDEYSIQINSASGGDPSVSLVPNRQNHHRVIDFHTWLTAWNVYLQAMAFYHPTRVSELIHYQSLFTGDLPLNTPFLLA